MRNPGSRRTRPRTAQYLCCRHGSQICAATLLCSPALVADADPQMDVTYAETSPMARRAWDADAGVTYAERRHVWRKMSSMRIPRDPWLCLLTKLLRVRTGGRLTGTPFTREERVSACSRTSRRTITFTTSSKRTMSSMGRAMEPTATPIYVLGPIPQPCPKARLACTSDAETWNGADVLLLAS